MEDDRGIKDGLCSLTPVSDPLISLDTYSSPEYFSLTCLPPLHFVFPTSGLTAPFPLSSMRMGMQLPQNPSIGFLHTAQTLPPVYVAKFLISCRDNWPPSVTTIAMTNGSELSVIL